MNKIRYTLLLLCVTALAVSAQITKEKTSDHGGSGPYKAYAVMENSLANFTIYRPKDLKAAVDAVGKLPILVWANGGCMNSSINYERFLTEIASQGYLIVAIGNLQMFQGEWVHQGTPDKELLKAVDWVVGQSGIESSAYFNMVDVGKIAAGGHSCGGAQVLSVADDSRIKGYMLFNSGMGDMSMAGASRASLSKLHSPIIYLVGGPTDVAYNNAVLDYARISTVPATYANQKTAGHGGTYEQQYGGSFGRMALKWLNWQFKGEAQDTALFLNYDLSNFTGWEVKSKNYQRNNAGIAGVANGFSNNSGTVSAYPNPVDGEVYLSGAFGDEPATLSVYNSSGVLVNKISFTNNTTLNTSSWKAGIYILSFSNGLHTRLVVTHGAAR